jgi:hypothetical protein
MHNLDVHRSLAETVKLHGAALAQRLAQESNHGKGACGEDLGNQIAPNLFGSCTHVARSRREDIWLLVAHNSRSHIAGMRAYPQVPSEPGSGETGILSVDCFCIMRA